MNKPAPPRDREEARKLLRDAEMTIARARHHSVNPVPHERHAQKLRQEWRFF